MYFMLEYALLNVVLRRTTARNALRTNKTFPCIRRGLSAQIHASKIAGKAAI